MSINWQLFIQQMINGLSFGAIYALIAVGYTMVYGVLRLINFAHGDVYMIGAMTGLYAATRTITLGSYPMLETIVVAALSLCAFAGVLLNVKRTANSRLRNVVTTMTAILLLVEFGFWTTHRARVVDPSWRVFLATLVCAMIICGLLGFLIERLAYRPLRNRPRLTALITAIGISMFLEFGGQRLFGATPQAFPQLVPGIEKKPTLFTIAGASVTEVDVIIFCVTIALMAGLRHIVMKTRTGMALRAVSFRFDTAALMGININRIIAFTFILGSTLAGAAGVMVAVKYPKVDPLMGLIPGIKAFIAAVLGGIGNIPGAVAGGFLLGLTEVLVAGYLPHGSQYRDGVAFVILIGVLLVKPSGLFGGQSIEKV